MALVDLPTLKNPLLIGTYTEELRIRVSTANDQLKSRNHANTRVILLVITILLQDTSRRSIDHLVLVILSLYSIVQKSYIRALDHILSKSHPTP